jgi:tripartite-type tricarboxylate transporter receptor subunit TctC
MASVWVARILATAITAIGAVTSCHAFDYAGKTVTIVVNQAAGGSTDIEARLLARHLSRIIPGNPTFIVQNVMGAGGSVAANWLGEVAKADGLVMGYLGGIAAKGALDAKDMRVDLRKFSLLGTSPGINVTFARRDLLPDFNKPDDFMRAKDFWIGGLSADSNKDVRLRMQMDLLGLNYHYLTGYKGSSEARLALRRKEIQVYVEALSAYRTSVEQLVQEGEVLPIWYDPLFKDGKSYRSPLTDGIPAEPFDEFVHRIKGSEPSGPMWNAYKLVTQFSTTFLYLMVMPPGTPKDAVEDMTKAIGALNADPHYQEDTRRQFGSAANYAMGPDLQKAFQQTMSPSAELRDYVNAFIGKGHQLAGR